MIKYKAVAILVLSLFLLVCGKTKNPVKNPPSLQVEFSQSKCKGSLQEKVGSATENGTVIFRSHGDTIWVIHQDAFYNCCSKIKVNLRSTPNGVDLLEYDVGDTCRCMCYFDITTIISGVSNGTYFIRVFDIDSNLAGSGVVDIPPKYTGSESSQSQCKHHLLKTVGEATSNTLEDSILVWSHGDTAWVTHKNALYYCSSIIKTRLERTPEGFDLFEYDIETGGHSYCICYFDITTTIFGVSPGTYLIRVFDTDSSLVGSVVVDIPSKYAGFESSQSRCKGGLYKTDAKATPYDLEDSVLVWTHADTAWVSHKNAYYNCASIIKVEAIRTPDGFDLFEHNEATNWARCMCYFDITTTLYGLSPGVYLIRVFDTAGNLVGEVELVIPPK